jgi:hypothetical protein
VKEQESRWRPPNSERPARVLCLGGGAICAATMDILMKEECRMVVLDIDPHCEVAERCQELSSKEQLWGEGRPALLVGDAIPLAIDILESSDVDLLVPAIPGHAAGKLVMAWGKGRMSPRGSMALYDELNERLSGHGKVDLDPLSGTIIATLNTSSDLCPLDCTQGDICPRTGHPREMDLCEVLREVLGRLSFKSMVIRPARIGIYGGITRKDLMALMELMRRTQIGDVVAIATSCSCHAILNTFKVC